MIFEEDKHGWDRKGLQSQEVADSRRSLEENHEERHFLRLIGE